MSSLIECLVDPNCHGMHDDNYHTTYEKEVAFKVAQEQIEQRERHQQRSLDTWHVYASSGEYTVEAESLGHAYLVFTGSHYDDFVQAIVSSEMKIEGYTPEFKNEHSALCRSRISGETEDRCNCG
jgi:hypothetical protein